MELSHRIQLILEDANLAKGADDVEAIEKLIEEFGWDAVRDCLLAILKDDSQSDHWRTAMEVFWGAVLDDRVVPANKLIALLHYRFDPQGCTEDNLLWSITSKLKGLEYLSDYKPLEDPDVARELHALRNPA